jgi:peptidoglycan/xylan/chitin deacetylase (PgdA/CDA1 family)
MRRILYQICHVTGVCRLFARWNRHRPIVLAFHGVTEDTSDTLVNYQGKHLHRPIFERLMRYLASHYTPVSLEALLEHLQGGSRLPERAFVVTFDDGYRNVATVAAPILHELRIPATLFVVTRFVRDGEMIWTDRLISALALASTERLKVQCNGHTIDHPIGSAAEKRAADAAIRALCKRVSDTERVAIIDAIVRELGVDEASLKNVWRDQDPVDDEDMKQLPEFGVTIGSHTASHAILSRCDERQLALELEESKAFIEEKTGERCRHFSYPNGSRADFSAATRRAVERVGYVCAMTTVRERVEPDANVFEIPRHILTHNEVTLAEFDAEVSGLAAFLRGTKTWLTRRRAQAQANATHDSRDVRTS